MSLALHYELVGSGPAVVVLHGLFGAGRNWLTVARRLSGDYAFYLLDLRNHGQSPHHPSMTYLDMAADVTAVIEALQLDDVILVGHSMGGKAAMTLALNDARGIARLINIDIAPVSYPDRFVEMITAMLALDLNAVRRRADADHELTAAIPEQAVRQFVLQNLMFVDGQARWRANLPALRDQMAHILAPLPVAADARATLDTWFIRGELSDRIGPQQLPDIERLFANYHLETVAGGGHWPHAEAPAAFMAIFARALAGVSAPQ